MVDNKVGTIDHEGMRRPQDVAEKPLAILSICTP